MTLKEVHILLISLSVLLGLFFGGWAFHAWTSGAGGLYGGLSAISLAGSAGLAVYLVWFVRKVRTRTEEDRRRRKLIHPLAAAAAVWLAASRPAAACASCFGAADGPMIDAAKLGVWLLFGLVFAVQLGFAMFFVHLWRRARQTRPRFKGGAC